MKKRLLLLLAVNFILFHSVIAYAALVVRAPENNLTNNERILPLEYQADIFKDYLWATPPLYGKEVFFDKDQLKVNFAGSVIKFTHQPDGSIIMDESGRSVRSVAVETEADHYFNRDILKHTALVQQKYVPKTNLATEVVPVPKTYSVTKYLAVPGTKTYYDPITEELVEHSFVYSVRAPMTENYIESEPRHVLKTTWVWQSLSEQVLDIPQYTAFKFQLQNGSQVMIYVTGDETDKHYIFQHVGYCIARDKLPGILGVEVPVSLVLFDGDQDGFFDGPGDYLMYHSGNPYVQLQNVPQIFQDQANKWFQLQWLTEKLFLNYKVDPPTKQLRISDANRPFLKNSAQGNIIISNLPAQSILMINGRIYNHSYKYDPSINIKKFKAEIQYGRYKAVISQPGHYNQTHYFIINKAQPTFEAKYIEPPHAATVALFNFGFHTWQLAAVDDAGKDWRVFNENILALPGGHYRLLVSVAGTTFCKEITIQEGENWLYDFTMDTIKKSELNKPKN